MARVLILLIAFNAIFPASGIASVCASLMSQVSPESSIFVAVESHDFMSFNASRDAQVTSRSINNVSDKQIDPYMSSQGHCSDPSMPCNTNMASMDTMDCDSGCCASCVGMSFAVLTSLAYSSFSHLLPVKPASGDTNFYTHIISPELRPPLI